MRILHMNTAKRLLDLDMVYLPCKCLKNDFHAISLTDFLPIVNALEVEKSAVAFLASAV